jgi:hypothetical protein
MVCHPLNLSPRLLPDLLICSEELTCRKFFELTWWISTHGCARFRRRLRNVVYRVDGFLMIYVFYIHLFILSPF